MLLNILLLTGQPLTMENYPALNVNTAKRGTPCKLAIAFVQDVLPYRPGHPPNLLPHLLPVFVQTSSYL